MIGRVILIFLIFGGLGCNARQERSHLSPTDAEASESPSGEGGEGASLSEDTPPPATGNAYDELLLAEAEQLTIKFIELRVTSSGPIVLTVEVTNWLDEEVRASLWDFRSKSLLHGNFLLFPDEGDDITFALVPTGGSSPSIADRFQDLLPPGQPVRWEIALRLAQPRALEAGMYPCALRSTTVRTYSLDFLIYDGATIQGQGEIPLYLAE